MIQPMKAIMTTTNMAQSQRCRASNTMPQTAPGSPATGPTSRHHIVEPMAAGERRLDYPGEFLMKALLPLGADRLSIKQALPQIHFI